MKKIYRSAILLMLIGLMSSVVSSQKSRNARIQKDSSSFKVLNTDSVNYGNMDAVSDGNGVYIEWNTRFEDENLGFNLYRIEGRKSIKVNRNIIAGNYLRVGIKSTQGNTYSFFDTTGTINSAYKIESLDAKGRIQSSGLLYSRYESNLINVAGRTSQEFQKSIRQSNPLTTKQTSALPNGLKRIAERNDSLTDINKQREIAGKAGVKIGVKDEGIYRVTKTELQNAGFDTNTKPELWQLYLNGVQQAINVEGNGDFIEFYGKGIDTLYSDTNLYFLITGTENGKRMGTTFRRRIGGNVLSKNYDVVYQQRERSLYITSILNGERENFYGAVIGNSASTSVDFDLSAVDFSSGNSAMFLSIQGITYVNHQVEVKINGTTLAPVSGANRDWFTGEVSFPTSILQDGTNTLELKSLNGSSDLNLVGNIELRYKRLYQAEQDKLSFYTRNLRVTEVKGFTSDDIRVLDITYPGQPTLITNARVSAADKVGTSYTVSLPAHRTRNIYAFTESEVQQVSSISQNIPSNLSANTNAADLLIITNRNFLTEANAWATYRNNDGLSSKVIDIDDVYDEFGYGVSGARSITEFVNYAQNNWQTAPSYVLLLGDASNDPKNYTGEGFHNYVPIRVVDTLYEETGSDDAMVDYDDDGSAEIAIGRIPARVPQDVTDALAKVISFESSLSTAPGRGSVCASDLPNGYDFAGLCDRVQAALPATIPTSTVNRGDENAKTSLLGLINSGKYVVNYSGHGSTGVWAATSFFGLGDVPQLNNSNLSIFTMLTCLNGYFIRPVSDSLSERLLKVNNGGAVAVWSSSGSTTPDVQEVMATRYFNQLGNNSNMIRLGDFVKDAKSAINGGRDVRRSWVLLGDPSLKTKVVAE